MMMNAIVIARYKENLEWIAEIPSDFKIFIYNKGLKIESEEVIRKAHCIIDLKNVGRESETYLYHMISQVEAGYGFTVFAQGDPITHSPDLMNLLRGWRDWAPLQPLSWQWRADRNIPPAQLLHEYSRGLNGGPRIRPERYSLTTWNPLDFFDAGAYQIGIDYRAAHKVPEGINIAAHFLSICGFESLAIKASTHKVGVFSYGGIFAVRNDLVRTLSKERALKLYEAAIGHQVYGYILERMWLHLFGAEFELPLPSVQRLPAAVITGEFCFNAPETSTMEIHDPQRQVA
jgi:hypothetical protein